MKKHVNKFLLILILILAATMSVACTSAQYNTTPSGNNAASPSAPSPASQKVTVNISALNYRFDTNNITVPAGADVTVIFNNKEAIPHNVAFYTSSAATEVIFRGDVISGPKSITYNFKAPTTPGTYFFRCDVHPTTMTGTFTVTGS